MAIEAALIKPLVDALLALFRESSEIKLKRDAESALREVIRELLRANPDENRAETRIAIARAAGIISEDIVLAEDMLKKHRATKARTAGKAVTGRKRKPAAPAPAKSTAKPAASKPAATAGKAATRNPPAKKAASKTSAKKQD